MLKLELTLKDINYNKVILEYASKLRPMLEDKNDTTKAIFKILDNNNVDTNAIIANLLNSFTKEQLDGLILDGVNQYSTEIIQLINGILEKQNIKVELGDVKLEKV